MSIKSDNWVRRMVEEHGVIEPFEPGQVRDMQEIESFPMVHQVGVAQVLFLESHEVCAASYRDRAGKYMGQIGVTLPLT